MIPNITRGSRMAGLLVYLASTDADKTKNAHTDPHLVAGDAAIMAWYDDGVLDHADALAIAKHLDQPRRAYGVEVRQKDFRWDQAAKRRVENGYKQADVWHCSLSLRAEEGPLTDQQWGDIANDFVDAMGFTEASGKAQCRWAAINHGTSENGNHHIHIAVSLVREDGTKASTHGDYKRAQKTCRELEVKYGLEQLSTVHAARGYDRAEKATAVRDEREMHRSSLARKVRASAGASVIRGGVRPPRPRHRITGPAALREEHHGRHCWVLGSRTAQSRGSGLFGSVAAPSPPTSSSPPCGKDGWTRHSRRWKLQPNGTQLHAISARCPGPAPRRPYRRQKCGWSTPVTQRALVEQLRALPHDDHATWAKAAREVSGAFAAWSHRLEPTPGPLAATAAELSRTAQLRTPKAHGKPVPLPSIAGTAMLFMAASGKNKTAAQSALMLQLVNTAFAIHEMHQQSGRTREAQRIRAIVTEQLKPFAASMPRPVTAGAPEQAAPGQRPVPKSVELGLRGMAPTRPGSAVPTTPTPARTRQHTGRESGPVLDR